MPEFPEYKSLLLGLLVGGIVAADVDVATALPEPDIVVTTNGREIRSVDQEETVANLYPLPNPVNATG